MSTTLPSTNAETDSQTLNPSAVLNGRLRVPQGFVAPHPGVIRLLCVRRQASASSRELSLEIENELNRSRRHTLFECVDAWWEPTQSPVHNMELASDLEALSPSMVFDIVDGPVSDDFGWLDEMFAGRGPTIVRIRRGAVMEVSRARDVPQSWGVAFTGRGSANTVVAYLADSDLLPPDEGDPQVGLTTLYGWLGAVSEKVESEADLLEPAYRIACQKAEAYQSVDPSVSQTYARLTHDVASRLSLSTASQRLQALDEYRRRRFQETSLRESGPLASLRVSAESPPATNNEPDSESPMPIIEACLHRLESLSSRLTPAEPGRGARRAIGPLLDRIQEQLKSEARYLEEVVRQARILRDVLRAEPTRIEGGEAESLVRQLLGLERICAFNATERALNALSARGAREEAFPRLFARVDVVIDDAVRDYGEIMVTSVGLVPYREALPLGYPIPLDRPNFSLEVELPTIFLGRVDFATSSGVRLAEVSLEPEGGPIFQRSADALTFLPDGTATTGVVFLGA